MLTWPPGPRPRAGPIGASLLPALSPEPPRFIKEPKDQIGVSGGVASFVCQATGDPKPRVTWNKKGKKVNSQRFEVSRRRGRGGQPGASTPSPRGDHGGSHRRRHRNGPQVSRGSRAGPLPSRAPARPHPLPCGPSARPARPCQAARSATVSCVVSSKAPCPRGLSHAHMGPRPAPLLTGGSSHSAHTRVTRGRVSPSDTCSHACCSDFVCVAPPSPHTHTMPFTRSHPGLVFRLSAFTQDTDRQACPQPLSRGPRDPGLTRPLSLATADDRVRRERGGRAEDPAAPDAPGRECVRVCGPERGRGDHGPRQAHCPPRYRGPRGGERAGGRHQAPALGTHLRRHLPASSFGFSLWGALGRPSPARDAAGPGTCWQGLAAPWGKGEHGGTEVTPLFIFIVLFRF